MRWLLERGGPDAGESEDGETLERTVDGGGVDGEALESVEDVGNELVQRLKELEVR